VGVSEHAARRAPASMAGTRCRERMGPLPWARQELVWDDLLLQTRSDAASTEGDL
jgi:hypothetical protein